MLMSVFFYNTSSSNSLLRRLFLLFQISLYLIDDEKALAALCLSTQPHFGVRRKLHRGLNQLCWDYALYLFCSKILYLEIQTLKLCGQRPPRQSLSRSLIINNEVMIGNNSSLEVNEFTSNPDLQPWVKKNLCVC